MSKHVEIERNEIPGHPGKSMSDFHIERSAQFTCPASMDYLGSAVVHFYRSRSSTEMAFGMITQTVNLRAVEEGHADAGLKELRRKMMSAYGRKTG